jgi:ATP-dependent DNA ligase
MARPLGGRRRTEATALPGWIKPQLTKLVDQPPDGPEWLHELKFDGYRMHARLDRSARGRACSGTTGPRQRNQYPRPA